MNNKHNNYLIMDIETTGPAWDGKIVCIGCKDFSNLENKTFYDVREETLVMNFLKYFNTHKFSAIVGYNVAFDYRFIVAKCLKYRIKLNKFQHVKLLDIMKILKGSYFGTNINRPGTLDQWGKHILGRGKLSKDGSVKDLLAQGRLIDILDYCMSDVDITYRLFDRINQVMEV